MIIENYGIKLLAVSFLLLLAVNFSRLAFAQDEGLMLRAPSPAEAEQTMTDDAFNPVWLLILIGIPVLLYLLWPRKRDNPMDLSAGVAGVKGGRVESRSGVEVEKKLKYRDISEILNSIIP